VDVVVVVVVVVAAVALVLMFDGVVIYVTQEYTIVVDVGDDEN
jgi:hypothetical protein